MPAEENVRVIFSALIPQVSVKRTVFTETCAYAQEKGLQDEKEHFPHENGLKILFAGCIV